MALGRFQMMKNSQRTAKSVITHVIKQTNKQKKKGGGWMRMAKRSTHVREMGVEDDDVEHVGCSLCVICQQHVQEACRENVTWEQHVCQVNPSCAIAIRSQMEKGLKHENLFEKKKWFGISLPKNPL